LVSLINIGTKTPQLVAKMCALCINNMFLMLANNSLLTVVCCPSLEGNDFYSTISVVFLVFCCNYPYDIYN